MTTPLLQWNVDDNFFVPNNNLDFSDTNIISYDIDINVSILQGGGTDASFNFWIQHFNGTTFTLLSNTILNEGQGPQRVEILESDVINAGYNNSGNVTIAIVDNSLNPNNNFISWYGEDISLPTGARTTLNYTSLPTIPCLTNTCNILTPTGYLNITNLKKGDHVLTSSNKKVKIQNILKTTLPLQEKVKPYKIPKNSIRNNIPMIDTYISGNHAYQINKKWKLPKHENLTKEWSEDYVTFYHIKLPDYYTDHLIVNGIIMESWDGFEPNSKRNHRWIKKGNQVILIK